MPIARDSFWLSPQPGMMPTRACVSAKRASVDAISTSQPSASSKPPVIAKPLMAPMMGIGQLAVARGLAAQLLQVEPGAEGPPRAGEDQHVHVARARQVGEGVAQAPPQLA